MPQFRLVVAVCLAGYALATSLGCQMGRTAIHADSNSRTPLLGIELIPRKSDAKTHQIRLANAEQSASKTIDPPVPPTGEDTAWSRWIPKIGWPKRVPLPRTDLSNASDFELIETEAGEVAPAEYEF